MRDQYPRTTAEVQDRLVNAISQIFSQVIREWHAARDSHDSLQTGSSYVPRVDIAVGPFNNSGEDNQMSRDKDKIRHLYNNESFFRQLGFHQCPTRLNANPRCLMAVEIENRTGQKHRMGSILNASALGQVGIIIVLGPRGMKSIKELIGYINFITAVGKSTLKLDNLKCLTAREFELLCRSLQSRNDSETNGGTQANEGS